MSTATSKNNGFEKATAKQECTNVTENDKNERSSRLEGKSRSEHEDPGQYVEGAGGKETLGIRRRRYR